MITDESNQGVIVEEENIMNDELFLDPLNSEPLNDVLINDPGIVYPVEFFKSELCSEFHAMSILEFNACSNYIVLETHVSYLSLFLGLLCGFILAKAVADGWA